MTDLSLTGRSDDDAISKDRECSTQGRKIRYCLGLAEQQTVSSTDSPKSPLLLLSKDQV